MIYIILLKGISYHEALAEWKIGNRREGTLSVFLTIYINDASVRVKNLRGYLLYATKLGAINSLNPKRESTKQIDASKISQWSNHLKNCFRVNLDFLLSLKYDSLRIKKGITYRENRKKHSKWNDNRMGSDKKIDKSTTQSNQNLLVRNILFSGKLVSFTQLHDCSPVQNPFYRVA